MRGGRRAALAASGPRTVGAPRRRVGGGEGGTTLTPGVRLGHYEVLEPIGVGGMGEVYRARDHRLGRDLALKLLPNSAVENPAAVERFVREARAASALNHPNVVTIHEIGEAEQGRFIAMELVRGRTLRSLIGEPHPLEQVSSWGGQIARALAVAHAAGIIHRDVKPENIMLRDDGYVKVLDFGIARLLNHLGGYATLLPAAPTVTGMAVGTVKYMSPEQACAEPVDSATDVFSLGLVLYELATGRHPFDAPSEAAILTAILTGSAPAPSRVVPGLPEALDTVIAQMLDKNPRQRPGAADVEAALTGLTGPRSSPFTVAIPTGAPPELRSVGRKHEHDALRATLDAAVGGHGLVVTVVGEPGIGKSTLVEDFFAEVRACGPSARLARGRCSERLAGAEAYLPILEALDGLLRADRSIAVLMRTVAPTWYLQVSPIPPNDSSERHALANAQATSQERLKRELCAFLEEVSRLQPVVLFLDDLHWADVSTVDLISYVGTRLGAMRVLVVATYRPSEMLLSKHPFVQVKLDLESRGLCREVSLQFLTREDVSQYLAREFPAHGFPPTLPALIHAKTEGSPLFMVDLVRDLRARGVIARDEEGGGDGPWTLGQSLPDIERELPASIRGMIQRKIDQLGEPDRRLLAAASVQGYEFDSAVLVRLVGTDAADVEERLEELDHVHGFVRRTAEQELPDGELNVRYRFVHVLYQNALYASLTPSRRASWSGLVAQALLDCYGDRVREIAADLALLLEAARDFGRAAEHFLAAAQQAARVFANQESAALAQRGLALLSRLPNTPGRARWELLLQITLGAALSSMQGIGSADTGRTFERAAALREQLGDIPESSAVSGGLWAFYIVGARMERAKAEAEQMYRIAQQKVDRASMCAAHNTLGTTLIHLGEWEEALHHLTEGSRVDPESTSAPSGLPILPTIQCQCEASRALWALGYPDQGLRLISKALAHARAVEHPESLGFALLFAAWIRQLRGETAETLAYAEQVIALSREREIATTLAWGTPLYGWALAALGRSGEGLAQIRGSLAAQRAAGAEIARPQFLSMLVEAARFGGPRNEAVSAVEEALEASQRTGNCYWDADLYRLKADLLLEAVPTEPSAVVDVEACCLRALEIARGQHAKSLELRAATAFARLLQRQGRIDEARLSLSEIYGWFTEGLGTADLRAARDVLASFG